MIAVSLLLAVLALLGYAIYRMGKKSEREVNAQETIKTVKERNAISDDIKRLSDDDLTKRLSRWMRK